MGADAGTCGTAFVVTSGSKYLQAYAWSVRGSAVTRVLGLFLFVFLLSTAASSQDLQSLAALVRDGNVENKRDALLQLRSIATEAASRAAIPALSDRDEIVRATAASSVLNLPPPEAVRLLTPLTTDSAEFVRREAVYALGEVGDDGASNALIRVLRHDNELIVRAAAAAALGKVAAVDAVPELIAVVKRKPNEDEEYLRRSAARSIGQIAERVRSAPVSQATPRNFLPERFKPVGSDKEAATTYSRSFKDAVNLLIGVVGSKNETDDTRREAAYALGAIGDPAARGILNANLSSKDTYLAEICREALLKITKSE